MTLMDSTFIFFLHVVIYVSSVQASLAVLFLLALILATCFVPIPPVHLTLFSLLDHCYIRSLYHSQCFVFAPNWAEPSGGCSDPVRG